MDKKRDSSILKFPMTMCLKSACLWSIPCLAERTRSCSADFSVVTTVTPGHNYFFLSALRKVSASLEVCDYWLSLLGRRAMFVLVNIMVQRATKHILFSILNLPFCLAIGQKMIKTWDDKCTVLWGQDFSSLFLIVSWGSPSNYDTSGKVG